MNLTILDEHRATVVSASSNPDTGLLVEPVAVHRALGWTRKPQGWCRGEVCIPSFAAAAAEHDGLVDLAAFAALIDRPYAADPEAGVAAYGVSAARRAQSLADGLAPDFTLADVDGVEHSLSGLRGRKVALIFWASWCGCRYDLPEWQQQHAALAEYGFSVLSVAVDRVPADAAPWIAAAAPTHPAVIDADGRLADLYRILNVPTALWVDEQGRIVRPNETQFATDLFTSMSGLDSGRTLAALRRWVLQSETGLAPGVVSAYQPEVTPAQQQARTEAALALWLHRNGHPASAERHFAAAAELAPEDVTIWRGSMPLRGVDPMGDAYFTKRQELIDAGIPIYRPLPDAAGDPRGTD